VDLSSRIAITMGDPAGIGPEIIVKAGLDERLAGLDVFVIGDLAVLRAAAARFAPGLSLVPIASLEETAPVPHTLNVLDLANVPPGLPEGRAQAAAGKAAYEYIERAVALALAKRIDSITTAPINKESLHLAGHPYPGHTELLAALTRTPRVALMLAGKDLRVVLATTHVPLLQVPGLITEERVLDILRLTHAWLKRHVTGRPVIAVTGLNPHAGDGGIFGHEETTAIQPAIEKARAEGIEAHGPHPADALFAHRRYAGSDAVVAMYHDQGMIPVKMDSMGSAVNITLGLPILRTSVDHGTAFDIAGNGRASGESLVQALMAAARLHRSPVDTTL
jgi:4-hydroxythreonine-4-phosphate dehydrogenase